MMCNNGRWTLTRRTCPVQCHLREKRDHRHSKTIPLQVCEVPTNCTFQRIQPILRGRKIRLKRHGPERSLSKPLLWFCLRHHWQIPGEKQTVLGRDQAMARDEEVLPHLQRMGCFTTKFVAHLHGSQVHSHARAWLHTYIRLHAY